MNIPDSLTTVQTNRESVTTPRLLYYLFLPLIFNLERYLNFFVRSLILVFKYQKKKTFFEADLSFDRINRNRLSNGRDRRVAFPGRLLNLSFEFF